MVAAGHIKRFLDLIHQVAEKVLLEAANELLEVFDERIAAELAQRKPVDSNPVDFRFYAMLDDYLLGFLEPAVLYCGLLGKRSQEIGSCHELLLVQPEYALEGAGIVHDDLRDVAPEGLREGHLKVLPQVFTHLFESARSLLIETAVQP